MRCESWSLTVHPGQPVASAHCAGWRAEHSSSRDAQRTARLSTDVLTALAGAGLEAGEDCLPAVGVGLVRRVEGDPVDDVAVAVEDQLRDVLGLADDGERLHDLV